MKKVLVLLIAGFFLSACHSGGGGEIGGSCSSSGLDGIVNGQEVDQRDPLANYVVRVRFLVGGEKADCTGSLLAGGVVLTAAHCAQADAEDMEVVFPSSSCGGGSRSVQTVMVHPEAYANGPIDRDHDIALLKIAGKAPASAKAINLSWGEPQLDERESLTMIGYGRTDYEKENSGILRKTTQSVKNISKAGSTFHIKQSEAGVCSGDSGGPLIVFRNSQPVVIGVASAIYNSEVKAAAQRCSGSSIFTSVEKNREWIRDTHAQLTR